MENQVSLGDMNPPIKYIIVIIMALEPFIGPRTLFQSLKPIHDASVV
jgi:hypothetical protein